MNAKFERIFVDLAKSMADRSCRIPPIGAAKAILQVHVQSKIARARADFERFSEKDEH
ncbi:MAG: hypothetical protein WCA38_05650 [Candidatus Acidiferrales bacterium]|jgi:hypothetical protein